MDLPKLIIHLILFACFGCKQVKKGEGDLLFHHNAPGTAIQVGQLVELVAVERSTDGKVLWRSADEDRTALITRAPSGFAGDLHWALGQLSTGDSATLRIDSMHRIYDLKIVQVVPERAIDSFMKARMVNLQAQETQRLASFTNASSRPSGLRFTITDTGHGLPARTGDTVFISYTAKLIGGRMVDTALAKPRKYIAGINSAIAGLEEAMQLFPEKTKATLIIPSSLAFGEAGYEGIQAYTPLVYDVEIVQIKRAIGKRPTERGASLPDFHATNIANEVLVQKEDVVQGPCKIILFSTDCDHCEQLLADLEKGDHQPVYLISADPREAIARATARLAIKNNIIILHDAQKVCRGRFQASGLPAVYEYDRHHRLRYLK